MAMGKNVKKTARNIQIAELYAQPDGPTLAQIGEQFNMTRERVRQIARSLGVTPDQRGMPAISRRKEERRKEKRQKELERQDSRCREMYGISLEEKNRLRNMSDRYEDTPIPRWRRHQYNAKRRGIPFELTFAEWWDLWLKSGRWDEYGQGANAAVITRIDPHKGYTKDNVMICTQYEASCHYHAAVAQKKEGKDVTALIKPQNE